MPRQARLDLPGLIYHVIARGIERTDIFRDERDRERFIERLGELVAADGSARVYAWCLLSNHFHLLVRRGDRPLSDLMRCLMTSHAVRFNLRHARSGHLFQNRYKSILVEEEPYFLACVRYVHLNPVRAGLVSSSEELDRFAHCGHAVAIGRRKASWQDVDGVLERFGGSRAQALRRYREFVRSGWNEGHRREFSGGGSVRSAGGREAVQERPEAEREAADARILGSGGFVEEVSRAKEGVAMARPKRPWTEVLDEVARGGRVTPDQILGRSRERSVSRARREFLLRAHAQSGLTMAELARVCGMSHVSVRDALKKARAESQPAA